MKIAQLIPGHSQSIRGLFSVTLWLFNIAMGNFSMAGQRDLFGAGGFVALIEGTVGKLFTSWGGFHMFSSSMDIVGIIAQVCSYH